MTQHRNQEKDVVSVLQLGNPTGMYGAERWILALARHLDAKKIRSIVGVIQDQPDQGTPSLCRYASDLGFDAVVFESAGRLSFSAVGKIRKFLVSENIDVLHTHGYKTDIIGRLATLGTPCRIVSTPHGWSQNAGIVLQVYETLDRFAFLFFDRIAPLSDDLYNGLKRFPFLRRKLTLIRNGVDIGEIDAERNNPSSIDSEDESRVFKVGYIGQLINRKRLDTLLRAFRDTGVDAKQLLIIGEGPQGDEYEHLAATLGISEQVQFLGFRADRIKFLLDFDVFVLPSELEGIPRCVMEAMAAGIPVIASDIPGCHDIVEHDINGLLFEVGDHGQLADYLGKVANDPELSRRLGEAGRKTVQREYSAQRMADEYAVLFSALAGRDVEKKPMKSGA